MSAGPTDPTRPVRDQREAPVVTHWREQALQAEFDRDEARAERDALRATVDRVRALADEWDEHMDSMSGSWAADRLRDVLGEPRLDAPNVWVDDFGLGGGCCGTCGTPTESMPCEEHQPNETERMTVRAAAAGLGQAINEWSADMSEPEPWVDVAEAPEHHGLDGDH